MYGDAKSPKVGEPLFTVESPVGDVDSPSGLFLLAAKAELQVRDPSPPGATGSTSVGGNEFELAPEHWRSQWHTMSDCAIRQTLHQQASGHCPENVRDLAEFLILGLAQNQIRGRSGIAGADPSGVCQIEAVEVHVKSD
jgi:hypothetical protein